MDSNVKNELQKKSILNILNISLNILNDQLNLPEGSTNSMVHLRKNAYTFTASKVSVFAVILVRIFPHSDQNDFEYGNFLCNGWNFS